MSNSSKIIDAFNAPGENQEPLHEVSGITEGQLTIGNGTVVDVTVAIADKNNAGGDNKRNGSDQVGISYLDPKGDAVYQTVDVVDSFGNALSDFGPEDIDYNSAYGVYVIVDEGGMKDYQGHPPTVYTAELKDLGNGNGVQMVIQSKTTMEVTHVTSQNGTFVDSDVNIGFTHYGTGKGNGVEGLAIDADGNIYMGEQDSGIVYKVEPNIEGGTIQGFNLATAKPILDTGSNDLAGLDFNSHGDLIASFGNYAKETPNSVVKFSANANDPPFNSDGTVLFEGSTETGTDKTQFDAEAVMVDSDGNLVMGSDNGFDYDGNKRYHSDDSTVLVALPEKDTNV